MIHGLTPGPTLFTEHSDIVYSIFSALLIAILFLPVIGRAAIGLFSKIAKLPKSVLFPVTGILCTLGVYGFNSSFTDIWIMLLFGMLAYVMRKFDFPPAPLLIAFILEPIGERAIRQSLTLSGGDPTVFFTRPISAVFLCMAVVSIFVMLSMKKSKK